MASGGIINRDSFCGKGFAVLRRRGLAIFACAVVAGLGLTPARAEYPDKIIKIVVPFAAGGGTDIMARTTAQEIQTDLGKPVIIENKPGAGTIIGTQTVATSEPDGYSLLMATFAHAVNPSLYKKLRSIRTGISRRSP